MSDFQKSVFLSGEGDAWFSRNPQVQDSGSDHIDDAVISVLGAPRSILEIGCSDGRRLARIRSALGNEVTCIGIDPSIEAVTRGIAIHDGLDLRIGTADQLEGIEETDSVILGFCLYLCDRSLITKIVAEIDRVLIDGGTLVIVDFDPPKPSRRRYRHREGVWSYKMDYSSLFTTFPQYVLAGKRSMSHAGDEFDSDPSERIAVWTLRKFIDQGYVEEPD